MVVIIVIGVMAALALPRYQATMETVKAREGVSLLTALMGAQKRYALENDGVYTATLTDLDLDVPAPKYFNTPTLATSNPVASIQRNNTDNSYGNYTLTMTDVGVVACSGGSGSICTKIGY
jgi:type II secretory pathway pseudopilin PulG